MDDSHRNGQQQMRSPQASVEDLTDLVRGNAVMAQQLAERMLTWNYLREVMAGEAPPPVIVIQVPVPGRPEALQVAKDLAGLDLATLREIFMPLIVLEGNAVVGGCREQVDVVTRMNDVCDYLVEAHQEDQPPAEELQQSVSNRGVVQQPPPSLQYGPRHIGGHGEG